VASAKWLDTTAFAEKVVYDFTTKLVIRQGISTLQQPERVGFYDGFPKPRLSTNRTIALARALGQVDFTFEADTDTVAAAFVCLLH
jgi:hypothetical protein